MEDIIYTGTQFQISFAIECLKTIALFEIECFIGSDKLPHNALAVQNWRNRSLGNQRKRPLPILCSILMPAYLS